MTETRESYIAGQKPESYLSYQDFYGSNLYDALFRASLGISSKADADLLADEIRRLRRELSREQGNT
mgnify:CR=1 FL=1